MSDFQFSPIGVLRTPFIEKFGTPRQGKLVDSARATIDFASGSPAEAWLAGLEGFSHCWLITVFHGNLKGQPPPKVHPPRLKGKSVGVMASRSPHRPNPIGLTLARIASLKGKHLELAGVDLIDGTPILDIKPYIAEADGPENPTMGWLESAPWIEVAVSVTQEAKVQLRDLVAKATPVSEIEFLKLVHETLRQDPRAVSDKEKTTRDNELRWFWLRLYDIDCGFVFVDGGIEVRQFRPALKFADRPVGKNIKKK